MNRRSFLHRATTGTALTLASATGFRFRPVARAAETPPAAEAPSPRFIDTPQGRDWLARWEKRIAGEVRDRYCDRETGEELGWLVSPFLEGFRNGYLATRNPKWIESFVDWLDACLRRAVTEPDGFPGWPKGDGGGGESKEYAADSLLGEAMMLRPAVLLAADCRKNPELAARWGTRADAYLAFAERIFAKWDSRGCWRGVKEGGLWVVPRFGIATGTSQWSAGWEHRTTDGFSNPANKQNHIARWLLALFDVTGKPAYRERAEKWFRLLKSRLRTREDGRYLVWNYWDPAGQWDFKPDGALKHWIGVHPNGGYYAIDAEGIAAAFEHGLVFDRADLDRLIATNRDFMWNQQIAGARFRRIDGGPVDSRWKNSPGVLWTALVPHDAKLREIFVANHDPASWGGIAATPAFLAQG